MKGRGLTLFQVWLHRQDCSSPSGRSTRQGTSILAGDTPHSTLTKRLGALRMYARWCKDHEDAAFPLSADTRGLSLLGALGFAKGFLGIHGASSVLDSSRCKGAMYVGLETKGEPVQARPLTVAMVDKLEAAVLSARDPRDRIVAGFVAFCVHARLRVGDALRISREPLIDLPSGTSDGFIEVSTHNHKARALGDRRGYCRLLRCRTGSRSQDGQQNG